MSITIKNFIVGLIGLSLILLSITVVLGVKLARAHKLAQQLTDVTVAARSQYGYPGIYHSSAQTISNGEGTALEVDSAGRPKVSTTTNITISF